MPDLKEKIAAALATEGCWQGEECCWDSLDAAMPVIEQAITETEEVAYERGHVEGYEKGLMDPGSEWMRSREGRQDD